MKEKISVGRERKRRHTFGDYKSNWNEQGQKTFGVFDVALGSVSSVVKAKTLQIVIHEIS